MSSSHCEGDFPARGTTVPSLLTRTARARRSERAPADAAGGEQEPARQEVAHNRHEACPVSTGRGGACPVSTGRGGGGGGMRNTRHARCKGGGADAHFPEKFHMTVPAHPGWPFSHCTRPPRVTRLRDAPAGAAGCFLCALSGANGVVVGDLPCMSRWSSCRSHRTWPCTARHAHEWTARWLRVAPCAARSSHEIEAS